MKAGNAQSMMIAGKRKLINTSLMTENWGCPPKKSKQSIFCVGSFQGPVICWCFGRYFKTEPIGRFSEKLGPSVSFFQANGLSIISKVELLKLHQELWGHIFVGAYWDPNYMLDMSTKTSHKMTVMIKAPRKQTTLHGTASGSCIIL